MNLPEVQVSEASLLNIVRELRGLKDYVISKSSTEDIDELLEEGIEEIIGNIELIIEGVEYTSDEYYYLASTVKEC